MKKLLAFVLLLSCSALAQHTKSLHIPDDFPVTDDMLAANRNIVKVEGLSLEGLIFFKNTALKQAIIFEPYTDYHRYLTYLFYYDNIPSELTEVMELHNKNGDYVPNKEKKAAIEKIVAKTPEIRARYFMSDKKIVLGESKEKVLVHYPYEPYTVTKNNNIETFKWQFEGDNELGDISISEEDEGEKNNNPRVQNSYGHEVTMIFENNVLIALIIFNNIP